MSFTTVTVSGTYLRGPGQPASGTVSFQLSYPISDGVTDIGNGSPVIATLDQTGSFSVQLFANDDTTTTPTGTSWHVTEQISGPKVVSRGYNVQLSKSDTTVNLATLAPVIPQIPGFAYLTEQQANAVYATKAPIPIVGIQYVTTVGDDANDGLSWGTAKLTPAAAVAALKAAGANLSIVNLGSGSFAVTTSLNATNFNAIEFVGQSAYQTVLVLNCGAAGAGHTAIGIDFTGSQAHRLTRLQLYTIGQANPATIAVLQARSTVNESTNGADLFDVWINMHTDSTANGGKGTIGVYNNTAEIAHVGGCSTISADRPYVATSTNIYGITSAYATTFTATSMSVVDIDESVTLIGLAGPAITLDEAVNFRFRGYINRNGGTFAYAVQVLSICTGITIEGQVEGYTGWLTTVANIRQLRCRGTVNPAVGSVVINLDGSSGGFPGIRGGEIDIVPTDGNTNAHVLINGPSGSQLGIYNLDIHLWSTQSIASSLVHANLDIRADSTTPSIALASASFGKSTIVRDGAGNITLYGQVQELAASVSFAAGANNGSGAPTPNTARADEYSGSINFGSGTGPAAGAQVVVTFSTALPVVPAVTVMPGNDATQALGLEVTSVGTGGFTVSSKNAPAASQTNGTFFCEYEVAT